MKIQSLLIPTVLGLLLSQSSLQAQTISPALPSSNQVHLLKVGIDGTPTPIFVSDGKGYMIDCPQPRILIEALGFSFQQNYQNLPISSPFDPGVYGTRWDQNPHLRCSQFKDIVTMFHDGTSKFFLGMSDGAWHQLGCSELVNLGPGLDTAVDRTVRLTTDKFGAPLHCYRGTAIPSRRVFAWGQKPIEGARLFLPGDQVVFPPLDMHVVDDPNAEIKISLEAPEKDTCSGIELKGNQFKGKFNGTWASSNCEMTVKFEAPSYNMHYLHKFEFQVASGSDWCNTALTSHSQKWELDTESWEINVHRGYTPLLELCQQLAKKPNEIVFDNPILPPTVDDKMPVEATVLLEMVRSDLELRKFLPLETHAWVRNQSNPDEGIQALFSTALMLKQINRILGPDSENTIIPPYLKSELYSEPYLRCRLDENYRAVFGISEKPKLLDLSLNGASYLGQRHRSPLIGEGTAEICGANGRILLVDLIKKRYAAYEAGELDTVAIVRYMQRFEQGESLDDFEDEWIDQFFGQPLAALASLVLLF